MNYTIDLLNWKNNIMSRQMVKVLHTDNYFAKDTVQQLYNIAINSNFVEHEHGKQIPNFNLIQPGIEDVLSTVVGESLIVDEENSGIFRIPKLNIHFEGFDSPDEWCFAIALEKCTFNVYHHLSGAKNALEEYRFNYQNLLEWDYHTNILLEPNQGIFFRPWIFHSFNGGLIHQYRLKSTQDIIDKKIILVMGLPGSGKSTLSKQLAERLDSTYINADQVRTMYNDWDFSIEGRLNQSKRMRRLAALSENKYSVVDFVCPLTMTRDLINADYTIWMNTIDKSRFDDTNEMFESPQKYDLMIDNFDYIIDDVLTNIKHLTDS